MTNAPAGMSDTAPYELVIGVSTTSLVFSFLFLFVVVVVGLFVCLFVFSLL